MWLITTTLLFASFLAGFFFFRKPRFAHLKEVTDYQLSIIIPARNEQENIQKLLASIQSQSIQPFEVIVMNDHSTDRTREVSEQQGAKVIDVDKLPAGWNGKPYACFSGAKKATGTHLLFLDADLILEEGGLEKIMGLLSDTNTVWGICPFHKINSFYEEFSSVFNLMMVSGTGAFSMTDWKKSKLVGQAMLVSKERYFSVGGHEFVKDKVLENLFLTEHFQDIGLQTRTVGGKGALSMRMFPNGFGELVSSWKKGFVSGAGSTPPHLMIPIIIWMSGGLSSFFTIIGSLLRNVDTATLAASGIFYIFYALQTRWMYKAIGNFSVINSIFYPIFFIFFLFLFFFAAIEKKLGKKTSWKGRDVT